MVTIGPNGKYPLGNPIQPFDRGSVSASLKATTLRGKLLFVLEFGTEVSWLATTPEEGARQAKGIRNVIRQKCGDLQYDADNSFPLRVVVNKEKGVIETYLPRKTNKVVGSPEFWLGWAEHIERCVARLSN